jgi:ribonuclease VapC
VPPVLDATDSSAVVAILLRGPGHERLRDQLAAADQVSIGAPTVVESSLVLCARLGHAGKTLLARFLQEADIEVVEFAAKHWTVAADAYLAYGKGRHRAGLNFGDCMTYAVAKLAGEPLLDLGDDVPPRIWSLRSLPACRTIG